MVREKREKREKMDLLATLGLTRRLSSLSLMIACVACDGEINQPNDIEAWPNTYDGKADIYGADSRRELNDPSVPEEVRDVARSVAMAFSMQSIAYFSDEGVSFRREIFSDHIRREEGAPLCSDEPFREQISSGFCTAFLIAPQLIATAGHCVNGHTRCEGMAFAFDHAKKSPSDSPDRVEHQDMYRCETLIGRLYNPYEEPEALQSGEFWYDWAVMKLDRPVEGREPLKLAKERSLERGAPIYVVGHPHGLPMKFTEGSVVKDQYDRYLNTSLDIYQGNSGSPMFDPESHKVHGIVIRGSGGKSFELSDDPMDQASIEGGQCYQSRRCEEVGGTRGCFGNHVLRIDPIHVFTRPDLKITEQHRLVDPEPQPILRYSFSFTEIGEVDFATVHLNASAYEPSSIRVFLHHNEQKVELISRPRTLPYGRWTVTTELFAGANPEGEWVIEVVNEGTARHKVEWAQVMLGYHEPVAHPDTPSPDAPNPDTPNHPDLPDEGD